MLVRMYYFLFEVTFQAFSAYEQNRTHGEIVTYRTQLVIDEWSTFFCSVRMLDIVIGIEHQCPAVIGNCNQSGQGLIAQFQRHGFRIEEGVASIRLFGNVV